MKMLRITNQWRSYELIDLADVKSVTPARNPAQTLIRLKSGGYVIADEPFQGIFGQLGEAGVEIFS